MVRWYELIVSIVCVCVCVCALSHVKLLATPYTIAHQAPLWNFPGKNTGAGCQFLLQGIFLTQGLILSFYVFRIGRQILYHMPLGKPNGYMT